MSTFFSGGLNSAGRDGFEWGDGPPYLKQNRGEDGFDDLRKRYSLTPPAAPSWRRFWNTADKGHHGPV